MNCRVCVPEGRVGQHRGEKLRCPQYEEVLEDPSGLPPQRNHQQVIPLRPGAQQIRESPYRLQSSALEHLHSCIQQWLSNGWIRPSCSRWASPAFFVSRKNGELSLVVDHRGLNSHAQPAKFFLTLIDVLFDNMSDAKVFARVGLGNGFYDIRMKKDDICKTSFSITAGLS